MVFWFFFFEVKILIICGSRYVNIERKKESVVGNYIGRMYVYGCRVIVEIGYKLLELIFWRFLK